MNFNPNRFFRTQFFSILFHLGAAAGLTGCASVSIHESQHVAKPRKPKMPDKIFIRGFDTPDEAFRVDRAGEGLDQFQQEFQERMNRNLARRLSKRLVPTEIISVAAPLPRGNYWILEGRYDRVNQGSRALRSLVGFGLGGTKLEATAILFDASTKKPAPLLLIRTTGGSGAMPGAVGALNPVGAVVLLPIGVAANAISGAHSGLGFDVARTSREITAEIVHYAWEHGMLEGKKPARGKRRGRLPEKFLPF